MTMQRPPRLRAPAVGSRRYLLAMSWGVDQVCFIIGEAGRRQQERLRRGARGERTCAPRLRVACRTSRCSRRPCRDTHGLLHRSPCLLPYGVAPVSTRQPGCFDIVESPSSDALSKPSSCRSQSSPIPGSSRCCSAGPLLFLGGIVMVSVALGMSSAPPADIPIGRRRLRRTSCWVYCSVLADCW